MPIEFHLPLQPKIPLPLTQAITGPPSDGKDKSKPILLIPDISYLVKFANGELGIADTLKKQMVARGMAKPPSLESLKIFESVSNSKMAKDPKSYVKSNGKISVPEGDISLTSADNFMGLKALEKTAIKAIFESQKPYMEIVKIFVGILAKLEDCAARLSVPLDYTNPAKPKGLRPKKNPRAINYDKSLLQEKLSKLSNLQVKGGIPSSAGNANNTNNTGTGGDESLNDELPSTQNGAVDTTGYEAEYETISEVYSTGKKLNGIDYETTYHDIVQFLGGISLEDLDGVVGDGDLGLDEDNPTEDFPENIVLAVFDSNGSPMAAPSWLEQSGKWYGQFGFVGPTVWWWKSNWGDRESSINYPGPKYENDPRSWERVKKKDDNGDDMPDDPENPGGNYEKYFTGSQIVEYKNFIHKFVNLKVDAAKPDTNFDKLVRNKVVSDFPSRKAEARSFVLSKFDASESEKQLDAISTGGFLPGIPGNIISQYNLGKVPKQPFMPVEKVIGGKPLLIDPEGDYEMRIIKVDTTFNITYDTLQNTPEKSATILRFVHNSHDISMSDNKPFDITLFEKYKTFPEVATQSSYNVTSVSYDNIGLNFQRNLDYDKTFNIDVWARTAPSDFTQFSFYDGLRFNEIKKIGDNWEYRKYDLTGGSPSAEQDVSGGTYSVAQLSTPLVSGKTVTTIKVGSGSSIGKVITYYFDDGTTTNTKPSTWGTVSANWTVATLNQNNSVTLNNYKLTQGDTVKKTYVTTTLSEVGVPNMNHTANGFTFYTDSNTIVKWQSYKGPISPLMNKRKVVSINNIQTPTITTNISDLPVNAIRVTADIPSGQIIAGNQVTNNFLKVGDPYATSKFAIPSAPSELKTPGYGEPNPFQIFRYPTNEDDLETIYLIEAVLPEANPGEPSTGGGNQGGGGGGGSPMWYKRPHAIGGVKVFLSILSDIMTKLIPKIKQLMDLIKNPASFLFDILTEKLGENFEIFGPEFKKAVKAIPTYVAKIKQADLAGNIKQKEKYIKDLTNKIKSTPASNWIHIHPETGVPKFIWDGSAAVKFLSVVFGIKWELFALFDKKPPLTLIFKLLKDPDVDAFDKFINDNLKDLAGIKEAGTNANNNAQATSINGSQQYSADINGLHYDDVITEWYSTGKFVDGIDYEYTYLSEEIATMVKQADDLINNNPDDPNMAQQALDLYEEAQKKDRGNKLIRDKIDKLRKKFSIYPHPLFNLLLSLITTPLKIIFGIIEYIMNFFKELNPGNLVSKLKEFLSFKWIMEFFDPMNLLALIGIKFDIPKFTGWVKDLKNLPDDYIFDLSEVIDIVFIPKLFKVNKAQFKTLLKQPLYFLNAILCLIEAIINGFIDFVWALLGLAAILKAPHIKLCKKHQDDMTLEEIMQVLSGGMTDTGPESSNIADIDFDKLVLTGDEGENNSLGSNYDFIFEIKTSDGRQLRDLNREELEQWLEDNGGYDFIFNY
jgi:hypothetical protein